MKKTKNRHSDKFLFTEKRRHKPYHVLGIGADGNDPFVMIRLTIIGLISF